MWGPYTAAMSLPETVTEDLPLKRLLRRSERIRKLFAFTLVLLPLAFIVVTLVIPVSSMLFSSVNNPEVGEVLPTLSAEIQQWRGHELPPHRVVRALVSDLVLARSQPQVGRVAGRLNHAVPGY